MSSIKDIFRPFKKDISSLELPSQFTFPFFYQPDPWTTLASEQLIEELQNDPLIQPLFDSGNPQALACGKMFGVLVVQNPKGDIGFIAGFSGKLGPYTHMDGFVPSVFDLYKEDGFFLQEEQVLNQINAQIDLLEKDTNLIDLQTKLKLIQEQSDLEIEQKKTQLKLLKAHRKQQRISQKELLDPLQYIALEQDLIKQSLRDKHELRVVSENWQQTIQDLKEAITQIQTKIESLKQQRKTKSNALQNKLFSQYQFLNKHGQTKDLLDIFAQTAFKHPPAAAGDCAAPRLLQYAYSHKLHPLAMAEFWYGESPKSEIRKHLHYYPACKGKCEPILNHMLQGLHVMDNPLLQSPSLDKDLEIVYQDDDIIVVNKPHEFLSVPGIYIKDSVYTRIQQMFPNTDSPLIVHRLDMGTSGLLIIAKTKKAHKALQKQFLEKTVHKTYVALLHGIVEPDRGTIALPLTLDIQDRPRQMVCFTNGKPSITKYQVLHKANNTTKILFYPITGRTHQLRMHASHPLGLNCPIIGDDLYGKSKDRLYLHAKKITFTHPSSKTRVSFEVQEDF